jgi:hypothetical protein
MAKHVVIERIEGRSSKLVSYCNEGHMMDVLYRLATEDPSLRVEHVARDPKPGEIALLDKQRLALKAERKYLPGWTTYA